MEVILENFFSCYSFKTLMDSVLSSDLALDRVPW